MKLWNVATGKEIKEYKGHGYEVLGLCVCAPGSGSGSGAAGEALTGHALPLVAARRTMRGSRHAAATGPSSSGTSPPASSSTATAPTRVRSTPSIFQMMRASSLPVRNSLSEQS